MTSRPFDVVLWGCTGFTGKLVAKYFASQVANRVPKLRWALAGRSKEKLQALVDDLDLPVPVLIASANNQDEVNQVAASTKVLLSTAGPFAKYGTPVVEACVRSGCDYVDINGEVGWHKRMIDLYDEAARNAGVVLIPSSGFDSIPSDLGAAYMARRVLEVSGLPTRRVSAYVDMRGAFSGGTVASGIHSEKIHGTEYLSDPFLLGGEPFTTGGLISDEHEDPKGPAFDPFINSFVAPFGMATINTRIVRRSVGLFEEASPSYHADLYAMDFGYRERMLAPDEAAAAKMSRAALVPASKLEDLVAAGRLPSPGEGPDAETRAKSWFKFFFVAEADGPAGASGSLSFKLAGTVSGKDPGYDETAKMVSETAVMLATHDQEARAEATGVRRSGFLTPATALGSLLQDRLHEEGIRFEEAPLPKGVQSPDPDSFR